MSYKTYKTKLDSLCPVAIKLHQMEVHAPGHSTWGILTCDACGDEFGIGPNQIHGSQKTEEECVKQLEAILAEDHRKQQNHRNCYELGH